MKSALWHDHGQGKGGGDVSYVGPEQLQLLESTAGQMYAEIAARGGIAANDPLVADKKDELGLLQRLGLLREPSPGQYVVVDPQMVQSATVAPMGQRAAQLIGETSSWANAFADLAQTYRRSPATEKGPVSELHGDQIDRFLEELLADAREELLTAQPQTGRNAVSLKAATARDVAALQRGVQMRTIYQHAARRARFQRQYVAKVTAIGAEVRTLDEFFNRLIVVDRRVALVPAAGGQRGAVVIRDPNLVAYLVDMFERNWDRGRPFTLAETEPVSEIAKEQRAMASRMLIEGHPDSASAKRMGVSDRTYAAYLADLKVAYEAQTRFQLGYRMGIETARRDANGD
jgi:sugar-specific transcriptional regulator TrmB